MYLDQEGNITCNQSIYAAIRRNEYKDNVTLPNAIAMGDPDINTSYMGFAYDIERNGLEDKAYPAVRTHNDIGEQKIISYKCACLAKFVLKINNTQPHQLE